MRSAASRKTEPRRAHRTCLAPARHWRGIALPHPSTETCLDAGGIWLMQSEALCGYIQREAEEDSDLPPPVDYNKFHAQTPLKDASSANSILAHQAGLCQEDEDANVDVACPLMACELELALVSSSLHTVRHTRGHMTPLLRAHESPHPRALQVATSCWLRTHTVNPNRGWKPAALVRLSSCLWFVMHAIVATSCFGDQSPSAAKVDCCGTACVQNMAFCTTAEEGGSAPACSLTPACSHMLFMILSMIARLSPLQKGRF